jgi:hypothetical protein
MPNACPLSNKADNIARYERFSVDPQRTLRPSPLMCRGLSGDGKPQAGAAEALGVLLILERSSSWLIKASIWYEA